MVEKLLSSGEIFSIKRGGLKVLRIVSAAERLLLKLGRKIKTNDWADHYVANLKLRPDPSRSPSRDYELGLHLTDELLPHVDVRQLRPVLRHMRIRLKHYNAFRANFGGPICPQSLGLQSRATTP